MIPDNNISENAQDSQENMKKGGTTTHTSDNLLMDEIINSASETYRSRHSDSFNSSRFLLEEAKIKKEKQLLSEYISAKLDNEQAQKLPLDFVDQLYLKMKSVEKKESAIIIKAEKDARKVANPPDKKVPYIKEIPFNPGTVNIVQGPSNAGKTNFVMYLAACITTGNKPFGFDVRSFRKDCILIGKGQVNLHNMVVLL
jgi:AAA15 family ATPase/GTPase